MGKWAWCIITIGLLAAVRETIAALPAQGAPSQKSSPAEFHEGQMFPTTVFPSVDDGRPRTVADFRGNKLILHIFASW